MEFLLWWDLSIVVVASTLSVTEVDWITLDIRNSNHSWAKSSADFHQYFWIVVMSCSSYNCCCSCCWILALKNSRTHKNSVHTKLHHKCCISWSCYSTCGKVDNR